MTRPRVVPSVLLALLALTSPARAAGPLTSGLPAAGAVSGPSYIETWSFSGTIGDRVLVSAVTTSGLLNTVATLRPPGGGAAVLLTAADRWEYQLTQSGTWSLEISDQGLNDAGSYVLSWLNVTAGPLTHGGDLDGDAIASGEVRAGTTGGVGDFDAFTFSGTAGQRVVFGALEASGPPYNTTLTIYPPAGGAQESSTSGGNRLDLQLQATGTYTVVLSDIAEDNPGSYTVSFLNVSAGPHSTLADPDGAPIVSGAINTGTINGAIDLDAFTFSGTTGDRILVSTVATSGTLNTTAYLYPPNGGAAQLLTAADRWDFQLTQTGTHTLVIEDQNFGETGAYTLALLNLTAGPLTNGGDLDGNAIASGEVRVGTTSGVGDIDAFTFSGIVGQRVVFGALEASGPPYNTTLTIYAPAGGGLESSTSGGNRLDLQLQATGTYTVVLSDIAEDNPGSYTVSFLNVSAGPHSTLADPDGAPIVSGAINTGTINGVIDLDAFTFSGTTGDRILVSAVATSGTLNTTAYLYPPNGASAQIVTAADRWDFQLTQTGTHTLVIEDQNFGETGTFTLALLNLTAGPLTHGGDLDGNAIASGEVRAGTTSGVGDFDAFTFSGTAGQRVVFGALEASGPPYNTTLTIYAPAGGAQEASSSGGNRLDLQLQATGTYTVVLSDIAEDNAGSYTVSFLNVSGGPHSTLADPDGAPIVSGAINTGTINGVIDLDAFTFSGTTGDRILVSAVATSGALNTNAYLYPPNGAAAQIVTAADRWDFQLTQTGTHTLVIEDQNFGESGAFTLALLNLTAGPLTHGGDLDGDAIASGEVRAGTTSGVSDFDAFTFSGATGDRVVFAGVSSSGTTYNTTLAIYPPGGGTQEASSSGGDRLDLKLLATGTYTVVLSDIGENEPGAFSVGFVNTSAGPLTTPADLDGGWIASGQTRNGNILPVPDLDVYWFNAQPGDTAIINCFTTSGALNTQTYLYPPGGGNPVVQTAADNWTYAIQASGRYALLVQHTDLTQTGGYQLGLSGPISTVAVPGDGPVPARVALSSAHPNPSRDAASFTLALPRRSPVLMRVYDVRGALVRTLVERALEPGTHTLAWDGLDSGGRRAPNGVYMVQTRVEGSTYARRVVRLE